MPFPEILPDASAPIFASYCIDYRYDSLSSDFLKGIGYANSYYLSTNAGAALPLGYKKSCQNINNDYCKNSCQCCNGIVEMDILKKSFVTNLQIALTLQPITTIYLLNHQDCGAIRAFLPCSDYPQVGEQNKNTEICINADILTYAKKYLNCKFNNMTVYLGLIDSNGTVSDYDVKTKEWIVIYEGVGINEDGLWFGYKKGDIIKLDCEC